MKKHFALLFYTFEFLHLASFSPCRRWLSSASETPQVSILPLHSQAEGHNEKAHPLSHGREALPLSLVWQEVHTAGAPSQPCPQCKNPVWIIFNSLHYCTHTLSTTRIDQNYSNILYFFYLILPLAFYFLRTLTIT